MAVQKFLEELSVHQLVSKYNFIIPEIQREYVWGNNENHILDKFFNDIKESIRDKSISDEAKSQIKSLEKMFEIAADKDKESIKELIDKYLSNKDLNIGFLYSYRPDYYVFNDRNEDVYLIDGQQRFTTLFISLFYFALKEREFYNDFINTFRYNEELEKIAFDYRVRTLTHNFLIELISNSNKIDDLIEINQKTWFLTDFASDVTVKAVIKTFEKLSEHFKADELPYYQFLKHQVKFWHFKTEETSQGEELYITMNSRGQQLAENETIRARLFGADVAKYNQIEWGAKWELWQDFFWKNRISGGNADIGLNQFLRLVNIVECFSIGGFKSKELAVKNFKNLFLENDILDYVSLENIEQYFNSLAQLKEFFDQGFYSESYFTGNFKPEWLKGAMSQIDLMKLLPALMFLRANRSNEKLNRFIRFFSNMTNDIDIAKNPDNYVVESIQLTKAFLDKNYSDSGDLIHFADKFPRLLNPEEIFKLSLYCNEENKDIRNSIEEYFWKAEDFLYNKGKIGHLIQLSIYSGQVLNFKFERIFDYNSIQEIDMDRFRLIFGTYSDLVMQENEIWGDLLDTNVYVEENDRVYSYGSWSRNTGLLQLVLLRLEQLDVSLEDFLVLREKAFILNYKKKEEMYNEVNPKRQLYLYYILHKRLLMRWSWEKWNFGFYNGEDYPDKASVFSRKLIYQFFNTQWRYNVGYETGTGIWLQDNYDDDRDYLSELINWAKN